MEILKFLMVQRVLYLILMYFLLFFIKINLHLNLCLIYGPILFEYLKLIYHWLLHIKSHFIRFTYRLV